MECDYCGQPVRATEVSDGIERHDGEFEYKWVHDDGNPFCPIPAIASPRRPREVIAGGGGSSHAAAMPTVHPGGTGGSGPTQLHTCSPGRLRLGEGPCPECDPAWWG